MSDENLLRDVYLGDTGYRLVTRATPDRDERGQTCIAYEFYKPDGTVLFSAADFRGSPLSADDSDVTLQALLRFLTLRPGDTDADYFANYTQEQMDFAEGDAEYLSLWTFSPGYAFGEKENTRVADVSTVDDLPLD